MKNLNQNNIERSIQSAGFIFETSWEVCYKVGGIHTVLSTRARTMVEEHGVENILFVGPLFEDGDLAKREFVPISSKRGKYGKWCRWAEEASERLDLPVRVGQWNVPGQPFVALVDHVPLFEQKGILYYEAWERYGIDGNVGYGDYDESCFFSTAAAMVMKDAYDYLLSLEQKVNTLAIFNEWMTGFGLLYLKTHAPEIGRIFITHATSTGRSICSNGKPLYSELPAYNGDQMAWELNIQGKHNIEKAAAHHADGFATVSEVTDKECAQLLQKPADVVVPNGFEPDFLPATSAVRSKLRKRARTKLIDIASKLYGEEIPDDTFITITSGRGEFRNKGLDMFLDVMGRLSEQLPESASLLAVILVPGWIESPRADLEYALSEKKKNTAPMLHRYLTHWLHNLNGDPIVNKIEQMSSYWNRNVKVIYIPSYLNGHDGILNLSYYDTLVGADLSIFPSYYEPWGYTPLESLAFGVPAITTDLAGFGSWLNTLAEEQPKLGTDGCFVAHREDYNYDAAVDQISKATLSYVNRFYDKKTQKIAKSARTIASYAEWSKFYKHYLELYSYTLNNK
ncbi:MAG: glycogen/starch synthase [Porphyromonas sp.]|nr:glycogen/starch synthase [Porphyromonas sp.]